MKQQWSGVFAAALLAAAATVGAQVQSPSPATTPPADSNARPGTQKATPEPSAQGRTPNTTVVSGCIQSAPVATAGFVLANPQMTAEGDPAAPAGKAVGTTGVGAIASYRLEGDEKLISPHLNHQVRIKGSLQTSAAPAAGAPPPAPVAGSTAPMSTLKVESVEMLAETCPPVQAAQPAQPTAPPVR